MNLTWPSTIAMTEKTAAETITTITTKQPE